MNIMCAFAWRNNKAGKEKWIILKNVIIKNFHRFDFFSYKIFIFCRNCKNSYFIFYISYFIQINLHFFILSIFYLCLMSILLVPVNYFLNCLSSWISFIFSRIFIIILELLEIYNSFSFWLITIFDIKKFEDIWKFETLTLVVVRLASFEFGKFICKSLGQKFLNSFTV